MFASPLSSLGSHVPLTATAASPAYVTGSAVPHAGAVPLSTGYGNAPYGNAAYGGAYGGADMLSVLGDLLTEIAPPAGSQAYSLPPGAYATAAPVQQATTPVVAKLAQRVAAGGRGSEVWAGRRDPRKVHVTQVDSRYNPGAAANNRDCGPASVLMALRMVGLKLPGGVGGLSAQAQIDGVRSLAGKAARAVETTNHDLNRALRRAGARVRETFSHSEIAAAIRSGRPVILNGNPRNPGAYGHGFSADRMLPYNGMHWVTVSGYDNATGNFIVNDPLSKVGPVAVSPSQLEAYRSGGMGIVVSR